MQYEISHIPNNHCFKGWRSVIANECPLILTKTDFQQVCWTTTGCHFDFLVICKMSFGRKTPWPITMLETSVFRQKIKMAACSSPAQSLLWWQFKYTQIKETVWDVMLMTLDQGWYSIQYVHIELKRIRNPDRL